MTNLIVTLGLKSPEAAIAGEGSEGGGAGSSCDWEDWEEFGGESRVQAFSFTPRPARNKACAGKCNFREICMQDLIKSTYVKCSIFSF